MKINNKKYIISVILVILCLLLFFGIYSANKKVVLSDSFKNIVSWKVYDYEKDYHDKNDISSVIVDKNGVDDNCSVYIQNNELNDTRIYKQINVIPDSYYKISVMVNASTNNKSGIGANISAINCLEYANIFETNNEWKELSMYIKTSDKQENIELSLGLGGYSNLSRGYAYFDNLKIEKLNMIPVGAKVITFKDVYKNESEEISFAQKYAVPIFLILIGFVVIFSIIICLRDKNSEAKEYLKLTRKDYIIIGIFTLIALLVSFYKLGDNFAASSFWKAGIVGESVVVEFDKETNVRAMAHYGNIPNDGYYMISYASDINSEEYIPIFSLGEDIENESNTKKPKSSFFNWEFNYGIDFFAKSIKIEAIKPGWGINELAFFTLDKEGNYELIPVKVTEVNGSDLAIGTPDMLFDEQEFVPNSSTYMNSTYFDEIYFPRTAYEQINGLKIYELTHPPLGKIIISLGITVFGMNPFGWRVMGALFGVLLVPLMYLFAFKIFKNSKYAFIAAFLMLFDFMRIPQTRLATIDSYSTFFIICMYYFMYDYFINRNRKTTFANSLRPLFLSGLMFGLGAATKWSCLYAGGGLAFIFFLTKFIEFRNVKKGKGNISEWVKKDFIPTCLCCVLFFVIIPLTIYTLSYIPYLASNPDKGLIDIVIDNQKYIFNYHSKLVDTHPFESKWYTWAANIRPIWLYVNRVLPEGMYSTIASFGNPLVWIFSTIGVLASLFFTWRDKDKRGIILFVAYAFQYFPWILITRISFIYSYFTALPFSIMLLVYCISKIDNGKKYVKIATIIYLVAVLILFIMFLPVLMGSIVDKSYVDWLKWLPTWYF